MKLRAFCLSLILLLMPFFLTAQCAMCRAVLESSEDNSRAEGINQGIMYLMAFPYILVGGIGFFLWWYYKKGKKAES